MSSEVPFRNGDELTPRALYLLMQQRFQDNSTAVLAALTAQKEAAQKAEESATKRFDEFKREIGEKIDSLLTSRDTGTGKDLRVRELVGYLMAFATLGALVWSATHR
jgi:hypothetical protein